MANSMGWLKETLIGTVGAVGKLAAGVGKGLEEGFEELSSIPANYRFEKRQKLSGKYQVDLRKFRRKLKHKSVTIDFEGGAFSWSISHLDNKALTEAYWEALPDGEQIGINLAINNWANDLYEKHGMKPTG